jgi:hypothetical protein
MTLTAPLEGPPTPTAMPKVVGWHRQLTWEDLDDVVAQWRLHRHRRHRNIDFLDHLVIKRGPDAP